MDVPQGSLSGKSNAGRPSVIQSSPVGDFQGLSMDFMALPRLSGVQISSPADLSVRFFDSGHPCPSPCGRLGAVQMVPTFCGQAKK